MLVNRLSRSQQDEGMVTAEAAVVIPTLFVVLALVLTAVVTVGAQMKVVDASREAARLAARGESTAVAADAGRRLAPQGATVTIRTRSESVQVEVRAKVRPFRLLPSFTLHASVLAERETP
jgi:hypothetical protein